MIRLITILALLAIASVPAYAACDENAVEECIQDQADDWESCMAVANETYSQCIAFVQEAWDACVSGCNTTSCNIACFNQHGGWCSTGRAADRDQCDTDQRLGNFECQDDPSCMDGPPAP